MNISTKYLIFACVALVSSACVMSEAELPAVAPEGTEITITAMREGFTPDTKTVRESDGSVEWCPMDEISVFYGDGTNGGSKFISQNTKQAAVAEFKGRIDGIYAGGENAVQEYLYGIYPYSTNVTLKNDIATINLPSRQTAAEGTFSNGLFPTIARAKGLNLAFYNICGGVKFTVSKEGINSVTFKGNNGERLAGYANVCFDASGKPVVMDEGIGGVSEITVYAPAGGTFKPGKEYFIVAYPAKLSSGYTVTLQTSDMKEGSYASDGPVEIQRSLFGVPKQSLDKNVTAWKEITSGGGGSNSGIYLGIMGFNQHLYPYPISELTDESKAGFDSFIDNLNTKSGALLYYSVDNAITTLQSVSLPTDLSTVAIVTFTDGLDQGSVMMNDSYSDDTAYLDAVNYRIKNETVSGQPVVAYSIGLRGQDIADVSMFRNNLKKLASKDEYATEVTSMAEVNEKFKEIAEKLSINNYVQTITLKIPGLSNGTLVRLTFDNINSAEKSELYIEGTYNWSTHSLEKVKYEGLESTSGTAVKGVVIGSIVSFTFEGIHTDNNKLIDKQFIDEWTYVTSNREWQKNLDFDKSENSDIVTKRSSSVAIMLVLDCSSSLGSNFPKVQTNAKDFINTFYEAVDVDGDFGDNTIYSTDPKDLSLTIFKNGIRYYLSKDEYNKANLSNVVKEGLCVGSGKNAFIIALKNAAHDSMYWDIANSLYDLPTYEQGVTISGRWKDINNALKTFGGSEIENAWTNERKNVTNSSYYYFVNGDGGCPQENDQKAYVRQVLSNVRLSVPWFASPENDLSLAVTSGESRLFIDKNEYSAHGIPFGYEAEGLAICSKLGNFIIALKDANSDGLSHSKAMQQTEGNLPTYNQGRVISARWTDINDALKAFGGSAIKTAWTNQQDVNYNDYHYYVYGPGGHLGNAYKTSTCYARVLVDTF